MRSSGIITLLARWPSDGSGRSPCSKTTLAGESQFHVSTPLGIEPRSFMTGIKRTSGSVYESNQIVGSPQYPLYSYSGFKPSAMPPPPPNYSLVLLQVDKGEPPGKRMGGRSLWGLFRHKAMRNTQKYHQKRVVDHIFLSFKITEKAIYTHSKMICERWMNLKKLLSNPF